MWIELRGKNIFTRTEYFAPGFPGFEDEMENDDTRTYSDSEEEAIEVAIGESGDDVRYNLRPSVTTREQGPRHRASPLFPTVSRGGLEAQSAELMARLRKTLADAEKMLSAPKMSVANALAGRSRREPVKETRGSTALRKDQVDRETVDSSSEPYIYMDPHLLLAGGQMPHAGRLGPKTRECETARPAERSRWTGQDQAAGPRRDRQNSHSTIILHHFAFLVPENAKNSRNGKFFSRAPRRVLTQFFDPP